MLTKKQQELLLFIHQKLQEEGIPPSFDEMKDALELKSKSGIHRLITALEERGFIRRLPNRARALEIIRLPDGHRERMRAEMNADLNADLPGFNEPTTRPGSNIHTTANTRPPVDSQTENMPALARRGFTPSVIDGGLASASELSKPASNVLSGEFGDARSPDFDGANAQIPVQVPVMGRIAAGVPISAVENYSQTKLVPPDMVGAGEYFALEIEGESMIEAGIHDGDTIICHKTDTATTGDIVVAFIDDEEATLKRFRRQGNSIALEAANPAFKTRIYDQQRIKVQGRLVGLIRNYQ